MLNLGNARTAKSPENRRKITNGHGRWLGRVKPVLGWPLLIAVLFWVGATIVMVVGDEPLPYSVGKVLKQPVLSRVTFERIDELATEKARTDAQHAVPSYYRFNTSLVENIQTEFREIRTAAKAAESFEKFLEKHAGRWSIKEEAFNELKSTADTTVTDAYRSNLDKLEKVLLDENMVEGIRDMRSTSDHVILSDPNGKFRKVATTKLNYASNPDQVEALGDRVARNVFMTNRRVQPVFRMVIDKAIKISPENQQFRPVYVFDAAYTRARIEEAGNVPPVKVIYARDDQLLPKGPVTNEALALLKSEHEEYLKQRNNDPLLFRPWRNKRISISGIILLLSIGLSIYTAKTQPNIIHRAPRAAGVAILLLGILLIERFVILRVSDSPIWCILPVSMTAAILAIAYSRLFALGAAGSLALMTSLMLGTPHGMMISMLAVITATVLMLKEIRTRMKMLEVGGVASAVAYISTFLANLGEGEVNFFGDPLYAAIASMAGLSMVQVILPLIERAFKVTTSQTLLEWADTSRPLLRQLIEKAPGTWQHSHLLGSMAESAAEEIGANGLLVRVGAYYHDIGKTCKPNYFVENQEARMNAHRGLAPTMSLLVILAHVKDGLALAREHGLPPVLHPFIAEHHGTTLVKYFHHMATQEAKAAGNRGREISDTEFRYSGPRPRSRETAILMLCDGVEGAVRSLSDPTAGRIEAVVHDIMMARLMDGQFEECDITLSDLARVEQSLVRSLRAIHHGRISYPTANEPAEPAQAKTA
ncbi:MAG: HDIG domain-containing protein [Planctomycetes bacterium]|nr:HDIG domain-containing protein [Planctomycetota bacterium]